MVNVGTYIVHSGHIDVWVRRTRFKHGMCGTESVIENICTYTEKNTIINRYPEIGNQIFPFTA